MPSLALRWRPQGEGQSPLPAPGFASVVAAASFMTKLPPPMAWRYRTSWKPFFQDAVMPMVYALRRHDDAQLVKSFAELGLAKIYHLEDLGLVNTSASCMGGCAPGRATPTKRHSARGHGRWPSTIVPTSPAVAKATSQDQLAAAHAELEGERRRADDPHFRLENSDNRLNKNQA